MTTNPTPAPDAGHAAETMSNEDLLDSCLETYRRLGDVLSTQRYEEIRADYQTYRVELLRRLNTAPARTAGTETEPCLWCDGTGQEWSSSAKYKRVPCRYCKATGMTTPALNAKFKGEEPAMTPIQSPAPTEATARTPITDEPWRILSEWIGSGIDAHAAMAELAEAGYVIVSQETAHYARCALTDFVRGSDPDYDWTPYIEARGALDDALAARQPEGVRDGE